MLVTIDIMNYVFLASVSLKIEIEWMNHEDIMLSEMSQSQRHNQPVFGSISIKYLEQSKL